MCLRSTADPVSTRSGVCSRSTADMTISEIMFCVLCVCKIVVTVSLCTLTQHY